ncbi:MAG: excinuclease ABC subunit UvrC [Bacteroidales bacterium]|nr:excinuclease ABC subunit UvrC [Bacteroidales bacterium]
MSDKSFLKEKIDLIPDKPGVYQFYSNLNELLYVGKAKKLKKRVQSYFSPNDSHSKKVLVLVSKTVDIKYVVVETESDALLLENNLIKKYQPRYNILLKDDKTYPWICIKNESFPRVFSTRRYENDGSYYYGPYTSGLLVKTILDLIKRLYAIRTCALNLDKKSIEQKKYKPCLEYQIGNCFAPCIGKQTSDEYNANITEIQNILKGNLSSAQVWLSKSMNKASSEYKFEQAQLYKTKLEILKKYQSKSTIVSNQISNIDVFNILEKPSYAVVNFLKVVKGAIIQSYSIELKKNLDETQEELLGIAITEIRGRVKSSEKNVLVPIKPDFLIEGLNYRVPQKGDKKKLLDLCLRNCLAHSVEIEKRIETQNPIDKTNKILTTIKDDLHLFDLPTHIECFDNSNLQGTNPVSSCVVFRNAKPAKREYRHFNVKTVVGSNDFATMEEVVLRRYRRLIEEGQSLPQLIIIDGGKGQLSSAAQSLTILGVIDNVKLIGIAKRLEELYCYGDPVPLYLDKNSTTLKTIQYLRNEAHRFGVRHHTAKRSIKNIKSEMDDIKGIGETTKQILFKFFKTYNKIINAKEEELIRLVGKAKANILLSYFKRK